MKKMMMRSVQVAILLTLFLCLGCGGKNSANSTGTASDESGNTFSITSVTIDGDEFSSESLSENKLTLVNVFATWCGPCVAEMPELQKIYSELQESGVGVIGIVIDTAIAGETESTVRQDDVAISTAKEIREKTGVTFPYVVPDANFYYGKQQEIFSVPTSFFVDSKGNIVGEEMIGRKDFDGWKEAIEKQLSAMGESL